MLNAIATGMSTSVRVSNWRAIDSSFSRLRVLERGVGHQRHEERDRQDQRERVGAGDAVTQVGVGRLAERTQARTPMTVATTNATIAPPIHSQREPLESRGAAAISDTVLLPSSPAPYQLATLRRAAASPPTRSMKRSKNCVDVRLDRDVEVGRPIPPPAPVGDGLAGRVDAAQLHLDGDRLGRTRVGSRCRRDRQRIVDECAVEAVVAAVELHVEAQRVVDEGQDFVCRPGRRRARCSWARCSGVILARSVTSRPRASGRGTVGVSRPASEHDLHRLRVDRHVPLGGRRRVAGRAVRAGHHHQPAEQPRQLRLAQERDREVGEWPERDQRDLTRPADAPRR